ARRQRPRGHPARRGQLPGRTRADQAAGQRLRHGCRHRAGSVVSDRGSASRHRTGASVMTTQDNGRDRATHDHPSSVEEVVRSLRNAAGTADEMGAAAGRLAATGMQQHAAAEQARSALEVVAASIEQTTSAGEQLACSQAAVAADARDVLQALEISASGLQEVAASVGAVRKDTDLLATGSESTTTRLEQTARTLKSTATGANELAE